MRSVCWFYRATRTVLLLRQPRRPRVVIWQIDRPRFFVIAALPTAIAFVLQLRLYASFGGISAFIETATGYETRKASFVGMGWIMLIAESFPIVAMLTFSVYAAQKRYLRSLPVLDWCC